MSDRKKLKMISSMVAGEAVRAGEASAVSPAAAAPSAGPDPEVRAVAKRRQFSAAYKLSVLEEAARCTSPAGVVVGYHAAAFDQLPKPKQRAVLEVLEAVLAQAGH